MRTQFERDGVKVAVSQDSKGKVDRIDVNVADGVHEVVVKRVMRHGEMQWEIKGSMFGNAALSFEEIWATIPDFVQKNGRRYHIASVVGEVVDATGKVTPEGNAISAARAAVEHAVEDFKKRYQGDFTMRLLRQLLEAEGYSVRPDRHFMKKLGPRAWDCFAYHELAGELVDRMFSQDDPPHVEEMFKMAEDWSLLKEFLET
jgi:hypothetical protein